MRRSLVHSTQWTEADYIRMEADSPIKHEFDSGPDPCSAPRDEELTIATWLVPPSTCAGRS
jgi:hypothetical protein